MSNFRDTKAVIYDPAIHDSSLKQTIDDNLGFDGSIIRFNFEDYIIYVPSEIYDKIKGWLKLPVDMFNVVLGKFWKKVHEKSIIIKPDGSTEIWIDGTKINKRYTRESIIPKTVKGYSVKSIISEEACNCCSLCISYQSNNCDKRDEVIDKYSIRDLSSWLASPDNKNRCKFFDEKLTEIPGSVPDTEGKNE